MLVSTGQQQDTEGFKDGDLQASQNLLKEQIQLLQTGQPIIEASYLISGWYIRCSAPECDVGAADMLECCSMKPVCCCLPSS
jgi:hypothetical protein